MFDNIAAVLSAGVKKKKFLGALKYLIYEKRRIKRGDSGNSLERGDADSLPTFYPSYAFSPPKKRKATIDSSWELHYRREKYASFFGTTYLFRATAALPSTLFLVLPSISTLVRQSLKEPGVLYLWPYTSPPARGIFTFLLLGY